MMWQQYFDNASTSLDPTDSQIHSTSFKINLTHNVVTAAFRQRLDVIRPLKWFFFFFFFFLRCSVLLGYKLLIEKHILGFRPLRRHTYSNILKILPAKNENFQMKNSDIFHISAQNIDCGYSLEPPRWGGSNEYPQSMFWTEIRKIMYTPVNPSFSV